MTARQTETFANGPTVSRQLVGMILCGGRSSRMGSDKNYLTDAKGVSFLQRIVQRLSEDCSQIVLVRHDASQELPNFIQRTALCVVSDSIIDTGKDEPPGPACALLAGLRHLDGCTKHVSQETLLFVTGNDCPDLKPGLASWLSRHWSDSSDRCLAGIVPVIDGQRQFLCSIMDPVVCTPSLERYVAGGHRSLRKWFASLDFMEIDEPQLRKRDPQLESFLNLNHPTDYLRWRASRRKD